jgi:hypothetical protein
MRKKSKSPPKPVSKSLKPQLRSFRLKDLSPSESNPRTIDPAALAGLEASIQRFGLVEPIIVNVHGGANRIVGGHQRLKVLQSAGMTDCTCVVVDLDEGDEKALNLALNNPHIQGTFTADLDTYLQDLRRQLADEQAFLDLRLDGLRQEIADTPVLKEQEDRPESDSTEASDATILVGEYRFQIDRQQYETWRDRFRQEHGFEPERIKQAIRERLGL